MSDLPQPQIDDTSRPYWEGLAQNKLLFKRCNACGHNWLPARDACPACLSADTGWRESNGFGRIVSWVIYHVAYHDSLKDRLPYDVTLVELDEGPRLLTNIVDSAGGTALHERARVRLEVQKAGEATLARFRLLEGGGKAE